MILSRFWYFCLVIVATLTTASTLLAANVINEQWEQSAIDDLARDRFEVEQTLKLDARARLDALAPLAANADIRTALRRASGRRSGQAIDSEVSDGLRTQLTSLNSQLAGQSGDLLFAVDKDGWIVAGILPPPGRIPAESGLGQFPLVRRALEGNVTDDVWVFNDEVFRMAARPVVQGGQFVGAIVHGKRFDDDLARHLSNRVDGASVAFFRGETVFASAMSDGTQNAPRSGELAEPLAEVLESEAEELADGHRTDPRPLSTGGLAVYSLMVGSARDVNVGYAIGRPVQSLARPWDITSQMSSARWMALPWVYIAPIAIVVLLLMMGTVWFEYDRPLNRLRDATAGLNGNPEDRLVITDFGGRYRRITENVNEGLEQLLEKAGTASPKRARANLDNILGPTADEQNSGGFFGFAGGEGDPLDLPEVPPAKDPAPAVKPAAPAATAAPRAARKAPARPPAQPAPPAPPAKPAAPAAAAPAPEPTPEPAAPAAPPQRRKALKRTLMGVPPASQDDDDEPATMVAQVPRELLEQAGGTSEEDNHFKEVFESFVAMKEQCGEPTAGLTFAKFSVTLRKNRDAIVKRHGATKVRFTVYEKNGKAALKATPIKS
ncbi:MAG: MXAN_5187 family protein [Sandaracinaceae bacterium]